MNTIALSLSQYLTNTNAHTHTHTTMPDNCRPKHTKTIKAAREKRKKTTRATDTIGEVSKEYHVTLTEIGRQNELPEERKREYENTCDYTLKRETCTRAVVVVVVGALRNHTTLHKQSNNTRRSKHTDFMNAFFLSANQNGFYKSSIHFEIVRTSFFSLSQHFIPFSGYSISLQWNFLMKTFIYQLLSRFCYSFLVVRVAINFSFIVHG